MTLRLSFNKGRNYLIGNIRWFLFFLNPKLIRSHILEQFNFRKESCPECTNSYETKCCGCDTPAVFFGPEGCKFGRYPKLLNKKDWNNFKRRKAQWERFINDYKSEEHLAKIGITRTDLYIVVVDVSNPNKEEKLRALRAYDAAQFIKIQDTNPEITLTLDE